jgi:iron(III) transport system permease protein
VLSGLILLPIDWLVWYSITDDAGQLTLGNFTRLAGDPSFALPYLTALGIACGVAAGACGGRAAPRLACSAHRPSAVARDP